jgi:hypothetical protein
VIIAVRTNARDQEIRPTVLALGVDPVPSMIEPPNVTTALFGCRFATSTSLRKKR